MPQAKETKKRGRPPKKNPSESNELSLPRTRSKKTTTTQQVPTENALLNVANNSNNANPPNIVPVVPEPAIIPANPVVSLPPNPLVLPVGQTTEERRVLPQIPLANDAPPPTDPETVSSIRQKRYRTRHEIESSQLSDNESAPMTLVNEVTLNDYLKSKRRNHALRSSNVTRGHSKKSQSRPPPQDEEESSSSDDSVENNSEDTESYLETNLDQEDSQEKEEDNRTARQLRFDDEQLVLPSVAKKPSYLGSQEITLKILSTLEQLSSRLSNLENGKSENNNSELPQPRPSTRRNIYEETLSIVATPLNPKFVSQLVLPSHITGSERENSVREFSTVPPQPMLTPFNQQTGVPQSSLEGRARSVGQPGDQVLSDRGGPWQPFRQHKAIVDLDKFSIEGTLRIREWLERYAYLAYVSGWNENFALLMLPTYLADDAYSWWRREGRNLRSWVEVVHSLLRSYDSKLQDDHYRKEYLKAQQKPDETVHEFALRLQELEAKSGLLFDDFQRSEQFVQGLNSKLQYQVQWVRTHPFNDAVKIVTGIELALKEREEREKIAHALENNNNNNNNAKSSSWKKQKKNPSSSESTSAKPTPPAEPSTSTSNSNSNSNSNSYRNGKVCTYCHKYNHEESECRKKMRDLQRRENDSSNESNDSQKKPSSEKRNV